VSWTADQAVMLTLLSHSPEGWVPISGSLEQKLDSSARDWRL